MKETNIRLLQLLADGDWHALREALSRCDLPTLHALIEASPAEAQAILFRLSPHRAAEALFEGFAPPLRRRLLTALAAMAAAEAACTASSPKAGASQRAISTDRVPLSTSPRKVANPAL